MLDKYLRDQMETTLGKLSVQITVLDKDQPNLPASLLDMTDGLCQAEGDDLYMPVKQPAVILRCAREEAGARDILTIAEALVTSFAMTEDHAENCYDVYRLTLRGEITGSELEAMSFEHQIPAEMPRAVLVFHMVDTEKSRAYDLLRDLTPLQDSDVLIDMDRHTVALIKDMREVDATEDLVEFAQALQETLMQETAKQITVGIGMKRANLDELHDSFTEAKRAIDVGRIFETETTIHLYERLVLERFLLELPRDISSYYHHLLFHPGTAKLFNAEMLYTIEMFFNKDLNLSDTARQLFIHRNTLVYRLDKVQRQTGLDLRKFDDAVTFKILMELKKCGGDDAVRE